MNSNYDKPVLTIRKEWFEHCKKSWYNEGYIDGKYNRKNQFEESINNNSNWQKENMINKACEWLNKNVGVFSEKDFRKAMED